MSAKHPHNFSWRFLHWPLCCQCGMLWLKNAASDREARKACPGSEGQ